MSSWSESIILACAQRVTRSLVESVMGNDKMEEKCKSKLKNTMKICDKCGKIAEFAFREDKHTFVREKRRDQKENYLCTWENWARGTYDSITASVGESIGKEFGKFYNFYGKSTVIAPSIRALVPMQHEGRCQEQPDWKPRRERGRSSRIERRL